MSKTIVGAKVDKGTAKTVAIEHDVCDNAKIMVYEQVDGCARFVLDTSMYRVPLTLEMIALIALTHETIKTKCVNIIQAAELLGQEEPTVEQVEQLVADQLMKEANDAT